MGILQDNWDDLLSLQQQYDKFRKSLSEAYNPCYISKELLAGTFNSSEKTIVCYLGKERCCNCSDYTQSIENVYYPCSHMYRLAYEFGLINSEGKTNTSNTVTTANGNTLRQLFHNAISCIENNLSEEEQLALCTGELYNNALRVIKNEWYRPFCVIKNKISHYLEVGLFERCIDSNLGLVYHFGFRNDIYQQMDINGYKWPENLAKTKRGKISAKSKRDWCLTHPNEALEAAFPDDNDIFVMVRLSENYSVVWDKVLQYFERKFDDEESFEKFRRFSITHPVGAFVTDYKCGYFEFPDDMVTDELNQYGNNRCLSKKPGLGKGRLYHDSSVARTFSFSIRIPTKSDYESFLPLIEALYDFYQHDSINNDIPSFFNVINTLKKLDELIDSVADDSIALLSVIRSALSKYVKDENEIKHDFLNVRVIMQSGIEIEGYENIRDISISQITHIAFPTI